MNETAIDLNVGVDGGNKMEWTWDGHGLVVGWNGMDWGKVAVVYNVTMERVEPGSA